MLPKFAISTSGLVSNRLPAPTTCRYLDPCIRCIPAEGCVRRSCFLATPKRQQHETESDCACAARGRLQLLHPRGGEAASSPWYGTCHHINPYVLFELHSASHRKDRSTPQGRCRNCRTLRFGFALALLLAGDGLLQSLICPEPRYPSHRSPSLLSLSLSRACSSSDA